MPEAHRLSIIAPILSGTASIACGSRFMSGQTGASFASVAGNRFLTLATNVLFGSHLTDMETRCKIMRTDVARSLDLRADRFDIEPEITARVLLSGRKIVELPVQYKPRGKAEGKKIKWSDGIHAVRLLIRHRFGRIPGHSDLVRSSRG
jgi:hypothetical protein